MACILRIMACTIPTVSTICKYRLSSVPSSPDASSSWLLVPLCLESCRKAGFQVAVSVVDSAGVAQVLLRNQLAGFSTPEGAIRKARAAINFRTSTPSLAQSIAANPEAGEIRNLPGVPVLVGGVIIQAEGSMVGAVGVAGAPGGEMDEKCANAGVEAIQETLDFL